jgi:hypothetical protein
LKPLTDLCHSYLSTSLNDLTSAARHVLDSLLTNLGDFICQSAERRSYGVRSKESILYEDESEDALWFWEVSNVGVLSASLQKNLLYIRQQRATIRDKVKCLEKLIQLIDKATSVEKDLPRIVEEFDKYNKVLRKENAAIQANIVKIQQ